jgi:hypothetical protein
MQLILAHFGFYLCELKLLMINFVSFPLELQLAGRFIDIVVIAFHI